MARRQTTAALGLGRGFGSAAQERRGGTWHRGDMLQGRGHERPRRQSALFERKREIEMCEREKGGRKREREEGWHSSAGSGKLWLVVAGGGVQNHRRSSSRGARVRGIVGGGCEDGHARALARSPRAKRWLGDAGRGGGGGGGGEIGNRGWMDLS
ncbi:unnamed protein product [Triticum turgidum subsp. durum]|uniref:Uncharacterized protein n=1 Tax=Triticum turgidum subsp. durum TaxID=4567 RepID=A0A9R0W3E6_TRITD|nr:unnamed protein product [Triticum turgidum subsp. durum]